MDAALAARVAALEASTQVHHTLCPTQHAQVLRERVRGLFAALRTRRVGATVRRAASKKAVEAEDASTGPEEEAGAYVCHLGI